MPARIRPRLGGVQKTMLAPLYARAEDARRAQPALGRGRAAEIRDAIEYDWRGFNFPPMLWALVARSAWLDDSVRRFARAHPYGTVVDVGAGLNDRFERLDNGALNWVDVDLPDALALRRKFFSDTSRCRMLAGSLLEPEWLREVSREPGPYCVVLEGVLPYLPPEQVRTALEALAARLPNATLLCDTTDKSVISLFTLVGYKRVLDAEMVWRCGDPAIVEAWETGWHLTRSHALAPIPPWMNVPAWFRAAAGAAVTIAPYWFAGYRLNEFSTVDSF